uniref:MHC class I-like antigen recognition-like domain-containing protein n=1 Tax=Laticauda laticaudata TaxID=8630 RepID=A0A8C5S932_LATLA
MEALQEVGRAQLERTGDYKTFGDPALSLTLLSLPFLSLPQPFCPPTLQDFQKMLLCLSAAPLFHLWFLFHYLTFHFLLPPLPPRLLSFLPDLKWGPAVPHSTSSHSLKYFSTTIGDANQGMSQFVTLGFVDSQVFLHYDLNSQKMQPRVSWVEKAGKEDPQYWSRKTHRERGHEEVFRNHLETLRTLYNQSEGDLTWWNPLPALSSPPLKTSASP